MKCGLSTLKVVAACELTEGSSS